MPSDPRFCACGAKLSVINRSDKCRTCKEKAKTISREKDRQHRLQEAKNNESVLVHSCLASAFDPQKESCHCQLLVSFEKAGELIRGGQAVDFETRQPIFCHREILEVGKKKFVVRGVVTGKAHIERAYTSADAAAYTSKDIDHIKRIVAEDRASRCLEEKLRIEIENDLTLENRARWIVEVPEDQWIADRDAAEGIPVMPVEVGSDNRTPGGIGIDVFRANHESEFNPITRQAPRQPTMEHSSHPVGVHFDSKRQKWYARTYEDGRKHFLGRFDTEAEARAAVDARNGPAMAA